MALAQRVAFIIRGVFYNDSACAPASRWHGIARPTPRGRAPALQHCACAINYPSGTGAFVGLAVAPPCGCFGHVFAFLVIVHMDSAWALISPKLPFRDMKLPNWDGGAPVWGPSGPNAISGIGYY